MAPKLLTAVPGFNTPAVGFEQPFEMLLACHDRVRRSLSLLQKLCDHVRKMGHDVVRYFKCACCG
jgi:hypothetical protein